MGAVLAFKKKNSWNISEVEFSFSKDFEKLIIRKLNTIVQVFFLWYYIIQCPQKLWVLLVVFLVVAVLG